MNPDLYSQTAQDPTQQQGLLQILQQIQGIQNQPLIPDNPLSQLGAALQGFSAGYAGHQNPAVQQVMAQRQQTLSGLSQTAGVLGQINMMQHQQATLEETRRARKVQEGTLALHGKTEERLQEEAALRIADDAWKKALEIGDPNMGAIAYDTLSKKSPGFFPPRPMADTKALLENAIARDEFKKNQVGMAAAAYLGSTTYLGKPIPQDVLTLPKRALALLAGKSETQLVHGSLDEWEVALRSKVTQLGGFDNLSPTDRADYLSLLGRNATDAKDAAIADIQGDVAKFGKTTKPLGDYFRTARQRQDLSQPLREQLKLMGVDPDTATVPQMKMAEDNHRQKQIVDATAKNVKQSALQEYNFRLGNKDKRKDERFGNIPTEQLKTLAFAEENALIQLLGALGVTMKSTTGAPGGPPSLGAMKNGKTRDENLQALMDGGMERAKAEREMDRLVKAGTL